MLTIPPAARKTNGRRFKFHRRLAVLDSKQTASCDFGGMDIACTSSLALLEKDLDRSVCAARQDKGIAGVKQNKTKDARLM
jgi:hypothetical protein